MLECLNFCLLSNRCFGSMSIFSTQILFLSGKTMFCGTHNSYHLYPIFIIYVQDVYYFLLIFLEFKIISYWDPAILKLNLFCRTIRFEKKSVGVIASFRFGIIFSMIVGLLFVCFFSTKIFACSCALSIIIFLALQYLFLPLFQIVMCLLPTSFNEWVVMNWSAFIQRLVYFNK